MNQEREYLVYARRSTDEPDNQKNSLDYQEKEGRRYARRTRLPIAPLSTDWGFRDGVLREAHSAFKTSGLSIAADGSVEYQIERPRFQRLVGLLAENRDYGLICLCMDRLSRNKQDELVVAELIATGTDVRFVQAQYDNSSSGLLHMDIDGVVAVYSSRKTGERVRATLAKMREEGLWPNYSPLGYLDHGPGNKPLDPVRAPLVKRLFELYATGEWSIQQLTKWANKHGLTGKPVRPNRTKAEVLEGAENPRPPACRPVARTGIEKILKNQFYIGKIPHKGGVADGVHVPLIDVRLFQQVQDVLEARCRTVHYVDREFFTYRGLLRCTCGRAYSPYTQKGHVYYRARCKAGCNNPDPNIRESQVDDLIRTVLAACSLTAEELQELEAERDGIAQMLDAKAKNEEQDLRAREKRVREDLLYLKRERISLLRNNVMSAEDYSAEVVRLEAEQAQVEERLANGVHAADAMGNMAAFSELLKTAQHSYEFALSQEKRELCVWAFTELVVEDRNIARLSAKQGLARMLKPPFGHGCGPQDLLSELPEALVEIRECYDALSKTSLVKRVQAGQPHDGALH